MKPNDNEVPKPPAIDRACCAHARVSPTKEIRGDTTTRVYGEHWRCEDCNLEFTPKILDARPPIRDAVFEANTKIISVDPNWTLHGGSLT